MDKCKYDYVITFAHCWGAFNHYHQWTSFRRMLVNKPLILEPSDNYVYTAAMEQATSTYHDDHWHCTSTPDKSLTCNSSTGFIPRGAAAVPYKLQLHFRAAIKLWRCKAFYSRFVKVVGLHIYACHMRITWHMSSNTSFISAFSVPILTG